MTLEAQALVRRLGEEDSGGDDYGVHITFTELYCALFFFSTIYTLGVATANILKMPALVGEIFAGIILGPQLFNIVPLPEAFVLLGEIGLVLLVLEAGIDIDLTTLRMVGTRGMIIALVGTILPIVIATMIAYYALGFQGEEAIAAGCVFAPTSLGIAMNVLRQSGINNTPVGQLIVAAAIVDDMVALVILSQLQAFVGDATVASMIIPIVSALGFLLIGGFLAICVLPSFLDKVCFKYTQEMGITKEYASMAVMFILLMILVPVTRMAKASPLMGAFVAGLVFCSSHDAHHMYTSQFKRVMQWLMRIFFAASIGFQVPVKSFASATVLCQGALFSLALLGKVFVGFLVPNFSLTHRFRGHHLRDCFVVGFSMAAEGEFAFVIAVFAVSNQLISIELYASLVLAILLSTILAPLLLRLTVRHFKRKVESEIQDTIIENKFLDKDQRRAVFFCIQTKSEPAWGIQTSMMLALKSIELEIIDHRSWSPPGSARLLLNEIYVKDSRERNKTFDAVAGRISQIHDILEKTVDQKAADFRVQKWTPALSNGEIVSPELAILDQMESVHGTQARPEEYQFMGAASDEETGYDGRGVDAKPTVESVAKVGALDGIIRRDHSHQTTTVLSTRGGVEVLDSKGTTEPLILCGAMMES